MEADLQPVADALADLDDDHLHALIESANGVPQIAPGLPAWIEHVVDWEINRRRGVDQGEFAHPRIEFETKGLGGNGGQLQGFPV